MIFLKNECISRINLRNIREMNLCEIFYVHAPSANKQTILRLIDMVILGGTLSKVHRSIIFDNSLSSWWYVQALNLPIEKTFLQRNCSIITAIMWLQPYVHNGTIHLQSIFWYEPYSQNYLHELCSTHFHQFFSIYCLSLASFNCVSLSFYLLFVYIYMHSYQFISPVLDEFWHFNKGQYLAFDQIRKKETDQRTNISKTYI